MCVCFVVNLCNRLSSDRCICPFKVFLCLEYWAVFIMKTAGDC